RAHALAGDVEASAVWFRRAIDLAATLPTEDSARIRISWLTTTFDHRGPQAAFGLARELLAESTGTDAEVISAMLLREEMFTQSAAAAHAGLRDLASRVTSDVAQLMVELDLAACAWQLMRPHEAVDVANRLLTRRSAIPDIEALRVAQIRASSMAWATGIDQALDEVDALIETTRHAAPDHLAILLLTRIAVLSRGARMTEASEVFDELEEFDRIAGEAVYRFWVPGELAFVESAISAADVEPTCFEQRRAELDPVSVIKSGALLQLAAARVKAVHGQPFVEDLRDAGSAARSAGSVIHEVLCLRELATLGGGDATSVDRLSEIADLAGDGLARIMALESRSLLEDDAEGMEQVAGAALAFGATGVSRDAWEAAHHMWLDRDCPGRAFAAALQAAELDELLGFRRLSTRDAVEILSVREREVADQLALGRTNSRIADELYISPRTVDRHVGAIFTKLRMHHREDVAALYPQPTH
ncbi:MAG: LuxR C-terminal-related transcriptional regulator, partial [Acidimicrobiales bacterium]